MPLIRLERQCSKKRIAPTTAASRQATMMNQRIIRAGRLRTFSSIGFPESLASVAMFMSGTFRRYRWGRQLRQTAGQMGGNCGFVKSDTPQQELAELRFEIVGAAVSQAGRGREPGQRRRQHRMMGKPEQVERLAANPRCVAGGNCRIQ